MRGGIGTLMMLVLVAVVASGRSAQAAPASEAPAVTIGGVQVPGASALARKEHPRLLFTRADIPRLRARLENPRLAKELAWAKEVAETDDASAILLGVLYHLTGEQRYFEKAKAKLQPSWIQTYPLAADLLMAGMTPEEQQAEADKMVQIVRDERWRPHLVLDLAAWGHGHDDFLNEDLKTRYQSDMVQSIEYNNVWSQGRGGSSMGHGYNGEHFYSEPFTMAVAWTNATGQDWVGRCDFAAHSPEWYLFHYRPWAQRLQVVHIGVTSVSVHWEAVTPAKFEGENLAVLAASRFHDGVGQWWVDNVISVVPMWFEAKRKGQGGLWGKLLWYDPDLPAVPREELPPARLFPENGHAVMRSDWTPEATYALFRCGRFGEIDGNWGRNNADNLHFIIEKQGMLAADTGGVHLLNNQAMGFTGGVNVYEYARQTIAHNSITVGREPITLLGWRDELLGVVRGGGQSPIQEDSWWPLWGLTKPKTDQRAFKDGNIVAYETSPLFDYACGDATHSYSPRRITSITRQFVYLRPDSFVVFDRVVAAEPGLETTWLLHSLYEPAWNGASKPDDSLPADKQFVVGADGKTLEPNPHPGGRFIHSGGDTFTIDDRWPGMKGRLFAKVLLPRKEERVVRTVGGAWHDFEVAGVNYGPTEETYSKHQGAKNPHNRENTIGVEGWRIELSRKENAAETQFLVVLHACDQTTETMPVVERVEANGQVAARVTVGGRTYTVTFAGSGPVGGHITVTEAGKTVVDRALAAEVRDVYSGWSSDPRYRDWMTNPALRNFIGAQEQDQYRARPAAPR
jgi:hypothetical protein